MEWIDFRQTIDQRLNREQLDEDQNRAKNFSTAGHALVRGVAGSGKSLILRNRVEKVLDDGLDSVLVLTYNRFMKGWTQNTLHQRGLNVECRTFHQWAYRFGYDYKRDKDDDFRKSFIDKAKKSGRKYQAILVDEAQDFYDEWFQLLLAVLDSQTNSLFFVYDNTQSVYGQPHRRKSGWVWSGLGIKILGSRSQVFDLNYRNSPEILELAWKFIQPSLSKTDMAVDSKRKGHTPPIDKIIKPKKKLSRSSSALPKLVQVGYKDMPLQIAKQIKRALEIEPHSSIGVLIHPIKQWDLKREISRELHSVGVRHHAPQSSIERDENVVNRPYIIVDSWNALKGVEFDAVIIAEVDQVVDRADSDLEFSEKAGLYTAMTRARDHLVMLYDNKTNVVEAIEEALRSSDVLDSEV